MMGDEELRKKQAEERAFRGYRQDLLDECVY